ncbi:MAG: photosynthetic complex assembly protein PuhC [Pseudomonadota bacterium]
MSRAAVLTPKGRRSGPDERIPRALIVAVAAFLVVVLTLVAIARLTGAPPQAMPPVSAVHSDRMLAMERTADGGMIVHDATTGALIVELSPQRAGFIGGVWRVVLFERRKTGADPAAPLRLVRWEDGRLSLLETTSDWRMELIGFGATNLEAFARLMHPA